MSYGRMTEALLLEMTTSIAITIQLEVNEFCSVYIMHQTHALKKAGFFFSSSSWFHKVRLLFYILKCMACDLIICGVCILVIFRIAMPVPFNIVLSCIVPSIFATKCFLTQRRLHPSASKIRCLQQHYFAPNWYIAFPMHTCIYYNC